MPQFSKGKKGAQFLEREITQHTSKQDTEIHRQKIPQATKQITASSNTGIRRHRGENFFSTTSAYFLLSPNVNPHPCSDSGPLSISSEALLLLFLFFNLFFSIGTFPKDYEQAQPFPMEGRKDRRKGKLASPSSCFTTRVAKLL